MELSVAAEDVLTLLSFHHSVADSCSMSGEPSSPPNKKMKYKYDKYQNEVAPTQVVSLIDEIQDTEIGHVDMSKFLERTKCSPTHGMQLLLNSHIHLVSSFPVAALEPEFVLACAAHFDRETRTIRDEDGNVVIRLYTETIDKIFRVLAPPEYADITMKSALDHYNQRRSDCIRHINAKWLKTPRTCFSRWPKLYRSDFIEEVGDMITLLSRIMGLRHFNVFEIWMYK